MAEEVTIRMIHDQTQKTEDATLDTMAEYQAQGFRVQDTNAYNRAVQLRNQAVKEAAAKVNPVNDNLHAREDAALVAARTYPDAPAGYDGEDAEDALDVSDEKTTDEQAAETAEADAARAAEKAGEEAKAEAEAREAVAEASVENTANRRQPTRTRRG